MTTSTAAQNTSPADDLLGGYSEDELHRAFDAVANKENWKLPIAAVIDRDMLEVTCFAIMFFTGSIATTIPMQMLGGEAGKFSVTADGYYAAVGA